MALNLWGQLDGTFNYEFVERERARNQNRNTYLRKPQKINKKAPRRARRKSLPFWVTPKPKASKP
jgi:replication initiation and membrane attachment protein DnaB